MSREKLESAKSLLFIALGADMVVTALVAVTDFWAVGVLNDVRSGISKVDQSTISTMEFWESFAKVMILTLAGVGFALVRWLGACYDYAQTTLKASGFVQEGWKTWGWIVPIMNLFKPYQVLSEIYKVGVAGRAEGDEWKKSSSSGMLLVWWIFWVIAHVIMGAIGKQVFSTAVKSHFDDLTLNQIIGMYYGSVTVCVISLVVAGLWFAVAGSLTRRLVSRWEADINVLGPSFSPAASVSSVSITPAFSNAVPREVTAKVQPAPSTPTVNGRTAMPFAPSQCASSPNTIDEDRVYALIAEELEAGRPEKGLWTRLFAECGGDEKETRVLYIRQRAQRLIAGEQARLEQLAHEQAVEAEKAERLRLEGLSLRDKLSTKNITTELSDRVSELSKTYSAVNLLNKVRLNHAKDVLALLNQEPLLVAVTNSEGDTALHIALREKYPSMVQLLLEKGAPVEASNAYGVTPIELANKSDRPELARLLSAVA